MSAIHEFVKAALQKEVPRADIADALTRAGWRRDEIENALDAYADVPFPVPVPKRKPYVSAQEAFLYLVLFVTLYISAGGIGTLLFQFINQALPSPLEATQVFRTLDPIRQAAASLLIAYPVFLFVTVRLRRAILVDPEQRASKVRKWLTYLTLFIAAGIIIGDLITLVFNLLQGELTLRFLLKVLSVGVIAGTIFGYYLWDLRRDELTKKTEKPPRARAFGVATSAAVGVVLVVGLVLGGPPRTERWRRLDEQRVQGLESLRYGAIDRYYEINGRLPSSIDEVFATRLVSEEALLDPETGAPYEFRQTGENTYDLCATFRLPSSPESAPSDPFWSHGAGYTCFSLDIRERKQPPAYSVPKQVVE